MKTENTRLDPSKDRPTSRRSFFRGAAVAGAGLGLAGVASGQSLIATSPGPGITQGT